MTPSDATPDPLGPFVTANATAVTDRLWVGGDLSSYDTELAGRELQELVDRGLTHVLDVREEWSDEDNVARDQPQLSYFWRGIPDLGQEVLPEWFDDVTGFALAALEDEDTIVLSHCHAGINRGPSAGFAVMLAQGWDPIDALDRIAQRRPIVMVAYAEDALRWAHSRHAMVHELSTDLARLAEWRQRSGTDLAEVQRQTRSPEL